MFNTILVEVGLSLADVRLLRHKGQQFDLYQSTQKIVDRTKLSASYWASFLGTPSNETMFAGLYHVKYRGLLEQDTPTPHMDDVNKAGSCDVYDLTLAQSLGDLVGKLFIDWGPAPRVWIQRADQQNKQITELRSEFKEPEFPGFLNFIQLESELSKARQNRLRWQAGHQREGAAHNAFTRDTNYPLATASGSVSTHSQ